VDRKSDQLSPTLGSVERRRSLGGQQKHLSGADQASRRQIN
jgi:hypothetical protein